MGIFVSRLDAYRNPELRTKPDKTVKRLNDLESTGRHPAAKYIMRLYKGDLLQTEYNGHTIMLRVAGFNTAQNKIDAQSLYNAGTLRAWVQETNPLCIPPGWKAKESQNHLSINMLFKNGRAKIMRISEDGQWINR